MSTKRSLYEIKADAVDNVSRALRDGLLAVASVKSGDKTVDVIGVNRERWDSLKSSDKNGAKALMDQAKSDRTAASSDDKGKTDVSEIAGNDFYGKVAASIAIVNADIRKGDFRISKTHASPVILSNRLKEIQAKNSPQSMKLLKALKSNLDKAKEGKEPSKEAKAPAKKAESTKAEAAAKEPKPIEDLKPKYNLIELNESYQDALARHSESKDLTEDQAKHFEIQEIGGQKVVQLNLSVLGSVQNFVVNGNRRVEKGTATENDQAVLESAKELLSTAKELREAATPAKEAEPEPEPLEKAQDPEPEAPAAEEPAIEDEPEREKVTAEPDMGM